MIIVAAIIMVGSGIAIPVTMRLVNAAKGDSSAVETATILQTARSRAVASRRNVLVTFPAANRVRTDLVNVTDNSLTMIQTLTLGGDATFVRAGLPDTPDRFGGALAINFTGPGPIMFTSDGSLIDSAGDVTNASIYIVNPREMETARAVTVWGASGLVRTFKWGGGAWIE